MPTTTTVPSYQHALNDLIKQLGEMLPPDKLAVFNQDATQLGQRYPTPLKLHAGDKAPLFTLPNARGEPVKIEDVLKGGPVVLTFYRGVWCPYCNLQLKQYQSILPQIKQSGANLLAISPMNPDNSAQMVQTNELGFDVLSDVGNNVARRYTTVFKNPPSSIQAMADLGYDFHSFYGDSSAELPVPATFVIAPDTSILFAHSAGGDYRERSEPLSILDALSA